MRNAYILTDNSPTNHIKQPHKQKSTKRPVRQASHTSRKDTRPVKRVRTECALTECFSANELNPGPSIQIYRKKRPAAVQRTQTISNQINNEMGGPRLAVDSLPQRRKKTAKQAETTPQKKKKGKKAPPYTRRARVQAEPLSFTLSPSTCLRLPSTFMIRWSAAWSILSDLLLAASENTLSWKVPPTLALELLWQRHKQGRREIEAREKRPPDQPTRRAANSKTKTKTKMQARPEGKRV